ncbi:hypothetical protein Tco_0610118, partial [Tanacetum coccineum]
LKLKRKVKPTEALKSPYKQRVIVTKNKIQDIEKRVADTIFPATGNVDDILFKSYFVDGLRIHFESMKFGNELIAVVLNMWVYLLNDGERSRSTQLLRKLFWHTAMIIMSKKDMGIFCFIRVLFLRYLKKANHPNVDILNECKISLVQMPWGTTNNVIDCGR